MKSIIYKNRIIFAISLGILTLLLITYLQAYGSSYFIWLTIPLLTFLSRKILGDGTDLSNKEKMILLVSYMIMAAVFIFFTYNIAVSKIINK